MTKDKETENESATDGVTETGGISAILDLLRIIQKDMDELKEENRIIKSQLVSHHEPIKLTELQQIFVSLVNLKKSRNEISACQQVCASFVDLLESGWICEDISGYMWT